MTNRELVIVYRAVKELASREPSDTAAKVLERVSRIAEQRHIGFILDTLDKGEPVPEWLIPGNNVPAKWGRESVTWPSARADTTTEVVG